MTIEALFVDEDGNMLGKVVGMEAGFGGSACGLFGSGTIDVNGKEYRCEVQLVEIRGVEQLGQL